MGWTREMRRSMLAPALVVGSLALLAPIPVDAAAGGPPTARPRQYEIVDLGTLPGGTYSRAEAINDRGWVVGSSSVGDPSGSGHAFLWRRGQMTDLGTLAGPSGSSDAFDINNRGEVVGASATPSGELHPTLWRDGEIVDLGTLGGPLGQATGINDRGEVVGWSYTTPAEDVVHAFHWRDGRMTDLGPVPGETFSRAEAINDRGHVVGESGGPVVWRRGVPSRLALIPDAVSGSAYDNNDRGDVVGYALMPGGASINRAVVWHRGVPTDLDLESGSSWAFGVNDGGQVVGVREPEPIMGNLAYFWERGRVTDLPSLVEGSNAGALAINDRGEIVGVSAAPGVPYLTSHAVLWR